MASSTHAPNPSNWRYLYSAEKERWNDINRMGKVVLPLVLVIFLATLAAVGFVSLHATTWSENVRTGFQGFLFLVRLYLTILLPILIAGAGIVLLYRVVLGYVKDFYAQYNDKSLLKHIQMKLLGVTPAPPPLNMAVKYPSVVVRDASDLPGDHWARWFGGPANLVIYDGVALYLERGNRFSRVVGPGSQPNPFLERFETIKAVVDLRPQVQKRIIKPWTKDGIQVEVEALVECQVSASDHALLESGSLVYPFDPLAVKDAVEYTAVRRNPETRALEETGWLEGALGKVTGYLARHISRHSIDEISLSELKDIGPSDGSLHTFELARVHLDQINQDLTASRCGACVTNIHIILKFPVDVNEKRLAYWKSERDRLTIIRDSIAEAAGIRVRQEARAKAQADVLDAITERLRRVGPENLTEPLLLSLAGILDNSLDDPLIRPFIARNSLELLEKLKKILNERF